jgi:hypothetical protein
MFGLSRMRPSASTARSRTRGWTGLMLVVIGRLGKCPRRIIRRPPSSLVQSVWWESP